MLAKSCSKLAILGAAAEVGLRVSGLHVAKSSPWSAPNRDPGHRFGLRVEGDLPKYAVGRSYVCWHGHRDFFLALFQRAEGADITTALARYRGLDDFMSKYRETEPSNHRCECSEEEG